MGAAAPVPSEDEERSRLCARVRGRSASSCSSSSSDSSAGRMLERLRQEGSRDGQGGERAMPVAVIVSADAGMEIVADLMREEGMSCHVIKTLADIRTVCQALSLL
eukprot:755646-Hanusia_phi.AAC.10